MATDDGYENPYDPSAPQIVKNQSGWISGTISGCIVGLFILLSTRFTNDYGGKGELLVQTQVQLTKLTTELSGLKEQLDRLIAQPQESKADHDRDMARIEVRLDEISRNTANAKR